MVHKGNSTSNDSSTNTSEARGQRQGMAMVRHTTRGEDIARKEQRMRQQTNE